MAPDLAALVREWQDRLRILDWRISAQYVDDLSTPDGSPAWGLCYPFVDDRSARILIRRPADAGEVEQVRETVVHELLHVVLAGLAGGNREPASVAAEEQVVWTLSPLLVSLGESGDGRMLARVMARAMRGPRGAGRSGGRSRMDQGALLAALRGVLSAEGDAEQKLGMLGNIIAELEKAGGAEVPAPAEKDPAVPVPAAAEDEDASGRDPLLRRDLAATVRAAVKAAIEPVEKRLDDAERAELFRVQGHKLTTEQRAAMAGAPLATVRALLAATPDPAAGRAARNAEPARGGRGGGAAPLEEDSRLDELMGIRSRRPQGPERLEDGRFRLHTMTPGEAIRRLRGGEPGRA